MSKLRNRRKGRGMFIRPHTKGRGMRMKPFRGRGILNTIIDHLPFSLHVPGYNYCGPGSKLAGQPAVNKLDEHCKQHDIFYSKNKDTAARNKADLVLADQAWERVKSADAGIGERAAAYAIVNAMKGKAKLGMGLKRNKKYGQLSNIKICKKNPSLQRSVHAKRVKKSKKKRKLDYKSR